MNNYSNFCRDLKQDLITFLDDTVFKTNKLTRPIKKLILYCLYGLLKTGSTTISEIARTIPGETHLGSMEVHLTTKLEQYDFTSIEIAGHILNNMTKKPVTILIDESDIIKPYGFKFEELGIVHDGSKEGRPKEKGYSVTGFTAIGYENTILPLILNIYSQQSKHYVSLPHKTYRHSNEINSIFQEQIIWSMDRGYDGKTYINPIEASNDLYIVRAKENRKYMTTKGKLNIDEISRKYKGKYSSTFINAKGKTIFQKFSAIKVKHKDLQDAWLIIESVTNEKDKRIYLTNIDCSTKEGCILALKAYRLRWRIEEYFRFIKNEYSFEKFKVRNLKAINNLAFIICLATIYISHLIISKNKVYYACMEAYRAFGDLYDDNNIIIQYGVSNLELYRLKRGIQEILSHSTSLPKVPGYVRKKQKYHQLSIFEIK